MSNRDSLVLAMKTVKSIDGRVVAGFVLVEDGVPRNYTDSDLSLCCWQVVVLVFGGRQ